MENKNQLEKLKEGIINRFTHLMNDLFSSDLFLEIEKVQFLILKEEEKLYNLREEYLGLKLLYKDIQLDWANKESLLKNIEQSLIKREKIVSDKESTIKERLLASEKGVLEKAHSRNLIIKEIENLKPEFDNLKKVEKNKQNLLIEINDIKNKITESNKNLDNILTQYSDTVSLINITKLTAENELENIKRQKEIEVKAILPTIQELDARKKLLDEKESGLAVIEGRWKKLYADKGVGFRV